MIMVGRLVTIVALTALLGCRAASESIPVEKAGARVSETAAPAESSPAPAGWPGSVPQPDAFKLEIPATGSLDPIVFVIERPVGEAWSSWRAQLAGAGVVIEGLREGEYGVSMTLCEGSCAPLVPRYALSLVAFGEQASRGRLIAALAREPVALPGACVAVPDTSFSILEHRSGHGYDHYNDRQLDVEHDYRWRFAARRELDLDRDGVFDLLVPTRPPDGTCPRRVEWDLWVTRGDCGHFVGHIVGDPAAVWRPPPVELAHELVVLPTRREPVGPQEAAVELVYAFDGRGYQETKRHELEARCDVHPADCDPMIRSTCRFEAESPAASVQTVSKPIVVPLFGVDGCPAPASSGAVPKVVVGGSDSRSWPLSPEIISRVIRRSGDGFERCYVGTAAHADCRNASVQVELMVDAKGVPVRAEGSSDEPGLGACTAAALLGLRFPEPEGGGAVQLRFPLRYRVTPE